MADPKHDARRDEKGEGNRSADRRYREAAKDFAQSEELEEAAREAAESVERGEDERKRGSR